MSFVLRRSERQRISTPFQFGRHRENSLTSSQSSRSHVNDGRTRLVEYLNASQMSQSRPARKLLDEPSIENANAVAAACVAKTLRSETQSHAHIASRSEKDKRHPEVSM